MKRLYVFLVVACFSLTIIESGLINATFFYHQLCVHTEYTDLSDLTEHSHSLGCDDIISSELDNNLNILKEINTISLPGYSFENTYITSVWQPPKQS